MLDDGVRVYRWDALNRLREVYRKTIGEPVLVAVYDYDAHNRRVRTLVAHGGLDGSLPDGYTLFLYDSWRVITEYEGDSLPEEVLQQYVYGNYQDEVWTLDNRRDGRTVGQLNDRSGSDRYFYHSNALYSVHGLTDEGGFLIEAYQYDAYGRQTVITDGNDPDNIVNFTANDGRVVGGSSRMGAHPGTTVVVANPFLFTGQRLDPETKLYYYKNRYYSTDLGRFITRDPIDESDINLYRYTANNPLTFVDPSGLDYNVALHHIANAIRKNNPGVKVYADLEISTVLRLEYEIETDRIRHRPDILIIEPGMKGWVYEVKRVDEGTRAKAEGKLNDYIEALLKEEVNVKLGDGSHPGTSGRERVPFIPGVVRMLTWNHTRNGVIVYRFDSYGDEKQVPRDIPFLQLRSDTVARPSVRSQLPAQAPQTQPPPAQAAETMPRPAQTPKPATPVVPALFRILPKLIPKVPAPIPPWWLPPDPSNPFDPNRWA